MTSLADGLPTGRRGQGFAVALTLVVLVLVWVGTVSPLLAWYAQRQDEVVQRQTLASHMAVLAASLPALQRQLADSTGDTRSAVLAGTTEAVAGAALQQRLQDMAERAAVSMSSAEVLASGQSGGFRLVRVHIAATGRWTRLVNLLAAVDRATPRMLVSEMQVGQSRSVTTDPVKPLDASFTVEALYAGGAAVK